MKYLFCIFFVFASINVILSQESSDEEEDDDGRGRGYGYTSKAIILKRIEGTLNYLKRFREEVRQAPAGAQNFFSEVDYMKIFTEKVQEFEAQHQEELQKSSNQACHVVFEKKKVELKRSLQDIPQVIAGNLVMYTKIAHSMEKKLNRMIERVNKYSAEAGDCRVVDNAQCELLARYYKEVEEYYLDNLVELSTELHQLKNGSDVPEEITQLIEDKIGMAVKDCLTHSNKL